MRTFVRLFNQLHQEQDINWVGSSFRNMCDDRCVCLRGVWNKLRFMDLIGVQLMAHYDGVGVTPKNMAGDGLAVYNRFFQVLAGTSLRIHLTRSLVLLVG